MSAPLTYEGILELFQKDREQSQKGREQFWAMSAETNRKIQEVAEQQKKTDEQIAQTAAQIKKTNQEVGSLTSRLGEIIENMVGCDIAEQFQALGIDIKSLRRNKKFGKRGTSESGEIDVFLENGNLVVLVEVKTRLTEDDVEGHIEQMEKYRLYGDDKRRILGAVAGGVVANDVVKFAYRQGLYVIVQSGEAVKIITPPKGFIAKEC